MTKSSAPPRPLRTSRSRTKEELSHQCASAPARPRARAPGACALRSALCVLRRRQSARRPAERAQSAGGQHGGGYCLLPVHTAQRTYAAWCASAALRHARAVAASAPLGAPSCTCMLSGAVNRVRPGWRPAPRRAKRHWQREAVRHRSRVGASPCPFSGAFDSCFLTFRG